MRELDKVIIKEALKTLTHLIYELKIEIEESKEDVDNDKIELLNNYKETLERQFDEDLFQE